MSIARADFIKALQALRDSLNERLIQDVAPADTSHNERARLLRNGLAIMLFSILEEFVRSRTQEIVRGINTASISFSDLPLPLQFAATKGAVKALEFQSQRLKLVDAIAKIQKHLPDMASSLTPTNYRISDLSFGRDKSNLVADDIKQILLALNVEDPWKCINALARRFNLGAPANLKDQFDLVAAQRHRAAHVASNQVPPSELDSNSYTSLAIAIGFDALASTAVGRLNRAAVLTPLQLPTTIDKDVRLISIAPDSRRRQRWRAIREGAKRATQVSKDPQLLFSTHAANAKNTQTVVVRLGPRSTPIDWSA